MILTYLNLKRVRFWITCRKVFAEDVHDQGSFPYDREEVLFPCEAVQSLSGKKKRLHTASGVFLGTHSMPFSI